MKQYSTRLPDYNIGDFVIVTTDTPIIEHIEEDFDVYCDKCNDLTPYCCGYEYKDKFYCDCCILDVVSEQ